MDQRPPPDRQPAPVVLTTGDVVADHNGRALARRRRVLAQYGWTAPLDDDPESGWLAA